MATFTAFGAHQPKNVESWPSIPFAPRFASYSKPRRSRVAARSHSRMGSELPR